VGKKSCFCCALLAKTFQAANSPVSFDLPASHGIIFPWALPTIGIPLPVAQSMEDTLMDVWYREVVKFAQEYGKPAASSMQSTMSLPSGSVPGDPTFASAMISLDRLSRLQLG
jgi:hypothetical protein